MTSSAAMDASSTKSLRKRRRACDACHKRKVRCDGIQQGQTACTYCLKSGRECTFESTPRKWPPSKNYVGGLEARVEHLERLLANIAPWPASGHALPWDDAGNRAESPDEDDLSEDDTRNEFLSQLDMRGFEDLKLDDDDGSGRPSAGLGVAQSNIYTPHPERRLHEPRFFHGKTSQFMVVRQLNELLASRAPEQRSVFNIRPEFTRVQPNSYFEDSDISGMKVNWPDPLLASQLIDGFFNKINPGFPILHKPTFLRQWADPANHVKREFAALAFAVFACGAKTLDDPRTKAWPNDQYKHSAGLPYWYEMRRIAFPPYAPPTLCRLQTLVLAALAVMGTPITPSAAWGLIGLASRLAQDAGVHRRSGRRQRLSPFEYEMRKRVFWALYFMDRTMASFLDRPLAFREEDYDVELPLELDDEQLDNLQFGRKVEEGECIRMAAWVYRLRLLQICSRALSTLYAARNTQRPDLAEWERVILINLSSSLNSLSELQPEKLKFDPDVADNEVYLHTALVNLQYQLTQILVYRPFLHPAKLALHEDVPSSAVCSGAARAIAHTIHGLYTRQLLNGRTLETGLSSFAAGTLLLMDMWQRQEADSIDEVEKCLEALSYLEQTWQMGGMVRDILTGLLQLTKTAMYRTGKRRRTGDVLPHKEPPSGSSSSSAVPTPAAPTRPQTSRQATAQQQPQQQQQQQQQLQYQQQQQPTLQQQQQQNSWPVPDQPAFLSAPPTLPADQTMFDPTIPFTLEPQSDPGSGSGGGPDFLAQIFGGPPGGSGDDQMGGPGQFPFMGGDLFDEFLSAMLGASQGPLLPGEGAGAGGSFVGTGGVVSPVPSSQASGDGFTPLADAQNVVLNSYQGNYGLF